MPLPAIAAAAYFGGWRMGALATLATTSLAFFGPWNSTWSLAPPTAMQCARLWGFFATGLLFSGLAELNHRYEGALVREDVSASTWSCGCVRRTRRKMSFWVSFTWIAHAAHHDRRECGVLVRNDGKLHDEVRIDALNDIVSSSERLSHIINDMLVLARADDGAALEIELVRPERIVQKVVAERGEGIRTPIHFHVAPYDGYAQIDESALGQIVENLVNNALKYSSAESPIKVTVRGTDDQVLVSVRDRGIGVSQHDARQMFTPFYGSEAAASRAGGLGLGLAVCKRLADAMDASLWVDPREGGGTAFTIALPKVPDEEWS